MPEPHISISELSKEFGITSRTLRHYEDYGLLHPERRSNQRLYSYGDRIRLRLILRGKRIGFSLSEIKEILDIYDLPQGEKKQASFLLEKIQHKKQSLVEQQQDISNMLDELDVIEKKLTN